MLSHTLRFHTLIDSAEAAAAAAAAVGGGDIDLIMLAM